MSARRQARAATAPASVDGVPPPELLNADSAVWCDRAAFVGFMTRHGWSYWLPAPERMGCDSHPANRRAAAAEAWALDHGVTEASHPDWHRLRELGLIAA